MKSVLIVIALIALVVLGFALSRSETAPPLRTNEVSEREPRAERRAQSVRAETTTQGRKSKTVPPLPMLRMADNPPADVVDGAHSIIAGPEKISAAEALKEESIKRAEEIDDMVLRGEITAEEGVVLFQQLMKEHNQGNVEVFGEDHAPVYRVFPEDAGIDE